MRPARNAYPRSGFTKSPGAIFATAEGWPRAKRGAGMRRVIPATHQIHFQKHLKPLGNIAEN